MPNRTGFRRVLATLSLSTMLVATPVIAQTGSLPQSAPTAGFPRGPEAPRGAPNVLLIMTDDVGFGASSTFGGAIPTPTFDALAAQGARYSAFHTTALCAPTRAALLTGRNSHRVGMGLLPDMATPTQGYNSVIPASAATVAKVLQLNGYRTAAFGKYHLLPDWEGRPGGPNTHLPNQMGFDYYYGFLGALTNPWDPELVENGTPAKPDVQDPSYHMERDFADHAIQWLRDEAMQSPGTPFFAYYAPGTLHAPLGAPAEWIARFKGKFDQGWDVLRSQIFERQKRMGIIPKTAKLAPMVEGTRKWDSLSSDEKRVAARYMEVSAAMLAYTDYQIGRVIDELKRSGQYDNTLIFYIQGDNGASPEGGEMGLFNYSVHSNGFPETLADNLARIDQIGSRTGPAAPPVGWARATDAPFPWNKGIASHLGGTRNGMVISWPHHVDRQQSVRFQFGHVNDIAPTIYEAVGITPPPSVEGVPQMPLDGTSLLYTLKDPGAPERHHEQYFEVYGNMGLYRDGWLLSSTPAGGNYTQKIDPNAKIHWELYNLKTDFSQTQDLAGKEPDRLKDMLARFDALADENHVKPINREVMSRIFNVDRGIPTRKPGEYTLFPGPSSYTRMTFPSVLNRSWSATATLTVPQGPSDGMIVTQGGHFAGWGLMILGGKPTFLYRATDLDRYVSRIVADRPVAPGKHEIAVRFVADDPAKRASGGTFTLMVDGGDAGRLHLDRTVSATWAENAQVGHDEGSTITSEYKLPFRFPGVIDKVVIDTRDPKTAY